MLRSDMTEEEYRGIGAKATPEVRTQMPPPEELFPAAAKRAEVARAKEERKRGIERKEDIKTFERAWKTWVPKGAPGIGLVDRLGTGILKGAGLVSKIRGIRHPDSLVQNKHLYFMGSGQNPKFTPLGRTYDKDHPMELYFGRRQRGMPEGAQTVYTSLQQGYTLEQLEVITGLTPEQVARSIQYLKSKGLWEEDWER